MYQFWYNRELRESENIEHFMFSSNYNDFLDKAEVLTQKLLKQAYVAHHYKTSTVVITTKLSTITYSYLKWQWIFYFLSRFVCLLYHCQDFYMTWLYIWVTRWMSYKLSLRECSRFFCGIRVAHLFSLFVLPCT